MCVHSTANLKSTAQNERDNLNNNYRYGANGEKIKVSFHAVIDDRGVIECIPITEGAYHTSSANANRNYYSIEICESGDRQKTLSNATQYISKILKEHNLGVDSVFQHAHFQNKNCPRILRQGNLWDEFKADIYTKIKGGSGTTIDKATEILRTKAGLMQETITFLLCYKYGDELVIKLADAVANGV